MRPPSYTLASFVAFHLDQPAVVVRQRESPAIVPRAGVGAPIGSELAGPTLTPTNGALLAMLAAAGVRYEEWLRFVLPLYGALMVLGAIAIGTALAIGL